MLKLSKRTTMYICVRCNQFYKSMAEVKACNHKPKQIETVKEPIEEEIAENTETLTEDDKKFNALLPNLDNLKTANVKFIANHLGIEFSTLEDTKAEIKQFLGI